MRRTTYQRHCALLAVGQQQRKLPPSKLPRKGMANYNPISIWFCFPRLIIRAETPATPAPLTVACVTAVFASPESHPTPLVGSSPCVNPRIPNPCSTTRWPRWGCPKKTQMIGVIEALSTRANVRRVNFLQLMIVVELIHGHGRDYPRRSLPGIAAGVATTYHHGPLPFLDDMKYHNRERLLDPTPYLQGPLIGPPPKKNETRRLLEADELLMNSHFEFEGMSKGLITLNFQGSAMERPKIPPGHAPIPILEWQRYSLYRILSSSDSSDLLD